MRSAGCTGARSEFQRARETRPPLYGETRADPRAGRRRPGLHPGTVELEAEAEAVRRAGDPLGPATRKAPEHAADVDNAEAVKRLICSDPPALAAATMTPAKRDAAREATAAFARDDVRGVANF